VLSYFEELNYSFPIGDTRDGHQNREKTETHQYKFKTNRVTFGGGGGPQAWWSRSKRGIQQSAAREEVFGIGAVGLCQEAFQIGSVRLLNGRVIY